VDTGSLVFFLGKYFSHRYKVIEKVKLIQLIITLRKSLYSTLREIAYASTCLQLAEMGIESPKVKNIIFDDGGSYLPI
jgi:hypothetical protein